MRNVESLEAPHWSSWGAGVSSATINNQMVFVGDKLGEYTITEIERHSVTVQAANGKKEVLTPIKSDEQSSFVRFLNF